MIRHYYSGFEWLCSRPLPASSPHRSYLQWHAVFILLVQLKVLSTPCATRVHEVGRCSQWLRPVRLFLDVPSFLPLRLWSETTPEAAMVWSHVDICRCPEAVSKRVCLSRPPHDSCSTAKCRARSPVQTKPQTGLECVVSCQRHLPQRGQHSPTAPGLSRPLARRHEAWSS